MSKLIDQNQQSYFRTCLVDSGKLLDLSFSDEQLDKLVNYLVLLHKWNKTYNLTAVRDPEAMLYRHLVDSLSIVSYISGQLILDVGTGPGLPGIPLAIMFPEKKFVLLDSNIKKTRFLTQSIIELGISNIDVRHGRVEEQQFEQPFDHIVSRAFAALDKMVSLSHMHLSKTGQFLAMKGLDPINEQEALGDRYEIKKTINLDVPGCEAQRHLIIIEAS